MGRREVGLTAAAEHAARVLGQQIRMARAARGMTAEHLAGSAGITRKTLAAIENGSGASSIGNVFNVATIVGVPLFGADDPSELLAMRRRGEERLALLPTRVDQPRARDDDGLDF